MNRLLQLAIVLALLAGAAGAAAAPPKSGEELRGYHLYGRYCVSCHGPNGQGIAKPTAIGGAPLRTQTKQRGLGPRLRGVGALAPDFYLRTGYMPLPHIGLQPRRSRVLLTDGQIRALVAYVASLGPGPGIPKPHPARGNLSEGQRLFAQHCAGCHQIVAEGGYVSGAVAPPLEEATATQVAEAVRIGPYSMPRFSRRALSDSQVDSIIAYVEYAKNPDDRGGWAIGHLGPIPEGLVTWLLAAGALVGVCTILGGRLRRG